MTWFVDANIFIRLLTKDDPVKADAAEALFESAAARQVTLTTSETVMAELIYVLRSPVTYRKSREEAAQLVASVLALDGLRVDNRRAMSAALELYAATGLDFVDCVAASHVQYGNLEGIYSYDHGLDDVVGLTRREPELAPGP